MIFKTYLNLFLFVDNLDFNTCFNDEELLTSNFESLIAEITNDLNEYKLLEQEDENQPPIKIFKKYEGGSHISFKYQEKEEKYKQRLIEEEKRKNDKIKEDNIKLLYCNETLLDSD